MSYPLSDRLVATLREDMREEGGGADLHTRLLAATGLQGEAYLKAVANLLGLAFCVKPEKMQARFDLLGFAECQQHDCILVEDTLHHLYLVVADGFNAELRRWAYHRVTPPHRVAVTMPTALQAALAKHEHTHRAMSQLELQGSGADGEEKIIEISLTSIGQDASPVVQLVNSTLYDAVKSKASDIHFERSESGLHVKYRIDGTLLPAGDAPGSKLAEQAISRIKVLAELDISEHRIPQDGRFKVSMNGRALDFRVSVMPSIWGEDAVLRILDKQGMGDEWKSLKLDILGLEAQTMAAIRSLAREPYGLLLVTGPTGSGKSTTLYSALTEINDGSEKIITIEDPVEYQLPGVLQIPVNDKKGLTFARGLRSVLRHDPDKILIGEIRDGETAGIAVQAAQTGHLVFASVHANSAFSVLDRFLNMGIDSNSFVDSLIGIVAQRLIRKNCTHCSAPDTPSQELLDTIGRGFSKEEVAGWTFRRGTGCEHCRGTGYLGRRAIAEVLRMNDTLKASLGSGASPQESMKLAREQGFTPLRDAALRAVSRGETTIDEVNRVTILD